MNPEEVTPAEAEAFSIAFSNRMADRNAWERNLASYALNELELFCHYMPGKRVLDVGCGWGRYAPLFIDQQLSYFGIDHSPKMIAAARALYPEGRFETMSFREPLLKKETFDALWWCCSLSTTPKSDLPTCLKKLRELLVPGGVMMVVENWADENSGEQIVIREGVPAYYFSLYDLPELTKVIADSGFKILQGSALPGQGAMWILAKREG